MNVTVQMLSFASSEQLQFDSFIDQAISFLGVKDLIGHPMALVFSDTKCLQMSHYLPVNCFYEETYYI